MRCPQCNHPDTRVVDSRHTATQNRVRRRRECERCKQRFTTYESIPPRLPSEVIKRDGSTEAFQTEKLHRSMRLAWRNFADDPSEQDKRDRLYQGVLEHISRHLESAIGTEVIANLVKDALRQHDPTACILYASVHEKVRSFAQWQNLINREKNELPPGARKQQMNFELNLGEDSAEESS